jgi:hypothetical protein
MANKRSAFKRRKINEPNKPPFFPKPCVKPIFLSLVAME